MPSSTVDKCFQVMNAITCAINQKKNGLKLKEIAQGLGFNITSTYRYIASLEQNGMIRKTGDDLWVLGPKVAEYYQAFAHQTDLRKIAKTYMLLLWRETEETIFLGCLSGRAVFYLDKIDSQLPIRPNAQIGDRNSLHSTGLGKAILAFSAPDFVNEVISCGLARRTENTIVCSKDLMAELTLTRQRGFSMDLMENEEQVHCVGAPIFDSTQNVTAALSISGPAYRMSKDRMLSLLGCQISTICAQISKELGYSEPRQHGSKTASEPKRR